MPASGLPLPAPSAHSVAGDYEFRVPGYGVLAPLYQSYPEPGDENRPVVHEAARAGCSDFGDFAHLADFIFRMLLRCFQPGSDFTEIGFQRGVDTVQTA